MEIGRIRNTPSLDRNIRERVEAEKKQTIGTEAVSLEPDQDQRQDAKLPKRYSPFESKTENDEVEGLNSASPSVPRLSESGSVLDVIA